MARHTSPAVRPTAPSPAYLQAPTQPPADGPADTAPADRHRLWTATRGELAPVSHALAIVITAIVVAGLLTAVTGFVETEHARAVDHDASVTQMRLAANLQTTSTLVTDLQPTSFAQTVQLPDTLAGVPYTITLTQPPGPDTPATLHVETAAAPAATATTQLPQTAPITNATVSGGPVTIRYTDNQTLTLEPGGTV